MKTIRVFACESQPIVLEGLKRALEAHSDLDLVGATTFLSEALEQFPGLNPEIVLIDQALGANNGLDVIAEVKRLSAHAQPVLWVTHRLTEAESFRVLQAGARGILKKTLPIAELIACLRTVSQGSVWMENSISKQVVGFFNQPNSLRLTPREQEVVGLVCRGMKNKQIADTLSITTGTVKVHLMHIFEKTGVQDRFQLAMQARNLRVPSEPDSTIL